MCPSPQQGEGHLCFSRKGNRMMMVFKFNKILMKTTLMALSLGVNSLASAELSHNATFELYERLQLMEEKVQSLNGQLEVMNNQLHTLQQRQLAQFKDIDARLAKMSTANSVAAAAAGANEDQSVSSAQANAGGAAVRQSEARIATRQNKAVMPIEKPDVASDKKAYQDAYSFIREKRYPQAAQAMSVFLKTYPGSKLAANAHYWLGELDLLSGDINGAMQEFQAIVSKHQEHNKVPDAMLKLGYIYDDIGQFGKARDTLSEVQKRFPGSTAAQLATTRLRQMDRV